ncbi:hypothetical protein MNEG_10685 [Monoraphidium neglectum]|uniref:Lipocalin/cytosolic fatty-acid binding domain-containing protein n=1 Tax=Monoraphidium neglectum TaxID=145388 RepID=A0A0D2KNQ9_9CHLO|nr:hypothetical protein MNEG_10685 [Monoraphidium neglectum]KIY97278.1 hypothetical protein MNEG_10685 [Monoraphidium neglectum]|eukprot:XP_013896298.1 hypothetical protein MNEG_10685 [Monoraphidium neglectum]
MDTRLVLLLACAACAAAGRVAPTAPEASCPPPNFDSAPGLDLTKFIDGPWYPQEQMPVFYQPVDSLYCVRAVYSPIDPANLKAGIRVLNTAKSGSVDGKPMGSSGGAAGLNSIVALPSTGSGPTAASKLRVGPGFLQPFARLPNLGDLVYGPYWVVAFADDYSWAIISGGPPKVSTPGACSAGRPSGQSFLDINGSGLWLFSRKPEDPGAVKVMRAKAAALGFDLSVLKPVTQKGCTYPST